MCDYEISDGTKKTTTRTILVRKKLIPFINLYIIDNCSTRLSQESSKTTVPCTLTNLK